jgi:hypothetical protein
MDGIIQSLAVFENIFSSSTSYVKENYQQIFLNLPKSVVGVSWWETVSAKWWHSVLRQHLDDELPQEVQEGLLDPLHPNPQPPGVDSDDTENLN